MTACCVNLKYIHLHDQSSLFKISLIDINVYEDKNHRNFAQNKSEESETDNLIGVQSENSEVDI